MKQTIKTKIKKTWMVPGTLVTFRRACWLHAKNALYRLENNITGDVQNGDIGIVIATERIIPPEDSFAATMLGRLEARTFVLIEAGAKGSGWLTVDTPKKSPKRSDA